MLGCAENVDRIIHNGQAAGLCRETETLDLTLAAWLMVYGFSFLIIAGFLHEGISTPRQIRRLGGVMGDILL